MEKNSEHYKKGNFLVKSQKKKKKQPFGVERVEDFFGFAFFFFPSTNF